MTDVVGKNIDYLYKKFENEVLSEQETPCPNPYDISVYENIKTKNILIDIDNNRNHSWIKEIWVRNKNNLNDTAIFYRGQKFSYRDFFALSYLYAQALSVNGLKKNQEFICCIENVPEFPFIMGATSIIGARVNLVAADMETEYLANIINNADSPLIFVSDKNFVEFSLALKKVSNNKTIISMPLDYSLVNGNPYEEITSRYYKLDEERYYKTLNEFNNVMSLDEFLSSSKLCNYNIYNNGTLSDEFTVTYTSGSTISNKPKGLIHTVRSYITMGRYHDFDVSHIPTLKNRTMLALVRTMSDTDFMSAISDVFMQGGITALEPINEKDFVLESMLINKPTVFLTSRSVWLDTMKRQMNNSCYKDVKLPFLFAPMCIGEPLDANEEKVLNKWLRKLKAGVDVTKMPFSTVCMSLAGGDSEHGGIFLTMYRSLQTKKNKIRGINMKEPIGMKAYDMVELMALRDDGTHCDYMEPGKLVANSPCTMEGYVDNPQAQQNFFTTDCDGKVWANLNTYGYIDSRGYAYVKGRVNDYDGSIPNYMVSDAVLKDTKKIMSCEVVTVDFNDDKVYVAHIEPQIGVAFDEKKVLSGATQRCKVKFGDDFLKSLYFRIHTNEESFVLTPTLKRSFLALMDEKVSEKCISALNFNVENTNHKAKVYKKVPKK